MTTDRYTWNDVRHAADLFFLALSDACPQVIPLDAIGFHVTIGSRSHGRSGSIVWRFPPRTPSRSARIPGGQTLPQSARDAYLDITCRARMADDLHTQTPTRTRKG